MEGEDGMGDYGKVALRATGFRQCKIDPVGAWNKAAQEIFDRPSSQKKGCPRGAFLGLCQEGYVKGVNPGVYTRSRKNKDYAIAAAELLNKEPTLVDEKTDLWKRATKGAGIKHNSQMDVVISLWEKDLIAIPKK
jgi:hypothetical protein